MKISGDVTDARRTTNDKRQTKEDTATQPVDAGRLSFAKVRIEDKVKLQFTGFGRNGFPGSFLSSYSTPGLSLSVLPSSSLS